MSKAQKVGLLCAVALALQVSAIATDSWSVTDSSKFGLWKQCFSSPISKCQHLPPDGDSTFPKNSLEAVRALAILGAVLVALCLGGCMFGTGGYPNLKTGALVGGAISSFVASGVWMAELMKVGGVKYKLGYSYYLNIAGGLVALVSAYYMKYM